MADTVKLGILGAGYMARAHIEALRDVAGCKVVGVSHARRSSLRKLEKETGADPFENPEELLSAVDAVDICLPTFLHEEATLKAARAGVHVLCEKPIALDYAAAKRMISGCAGAGVLLMVAHCLRFWPEYTFIKESMNSGNFGNLMSFHGWRHNCTPAWSSRDWLLDESLSGGPTLDLHIHDADMIQFLFGKPSSVRATGFSTGNIRSICSEFKFDSVHHARAEAGWYFPKSYPFHMGYRAVFENAVVDFHSQHDPEIRVFRPGGKMWTPKLKLSDGYREELKYFVDCVRTGREPSLSSAQDAALSLRMVLAAASSAKSGKSVRIS
ncbi:MAG TPA: Gfo/Idh/MocA family oxidoreductase [bacterium]|nr:Gfo/Idh/MocA family oxidoreductase [bacterium]